MLGAVLRPLKSSPRKMSTATSSGPRIHLILDWDGTITTSDTLHLVAGIGYKHHNREDLLSDAGPRPSQSGTTLRPWKELVQAYTEDIKAHEAKYHIPAKSRKAVQEEVAYLASLVEVENRSVQRTEDSELFKGVTREEVESAAKDALQSGAVELYKGWEKLLQIAGGPSRGTESEGNGDVKISVVSVNWSRMFIESCLRQSGRERFSAGSNLFTVYANELEGLEDRGVATGKLTKDSVKGIRTAADKGRYMPRRCMHRYTKYPGQDRASSINSGDAELLSEDNDEYLTVYIGDSATDLLCLLAADVGICIVGPDGTSSLLKILQRIGVEYVPIAAWRDAISRPQQKKRSLLMAKDFGEIADWIEDICNTPEVAEKLAED